MAPHSGAHRCPVIEKGTKNMTITANERLSSLVETLQVLYPESDVELSKRIPNSQPGLRLAPSQSAPRLAVPAHSRRAAQLAVLRPCASDTFVHTLRRNALGIILRNPLGALAMPAGVHINRTANSIEAKLEQIFDQPVLIALMTGSPRANRKPVLSIFDQSGAELGFAKVGLGELAGTLVENEYFALNSMAQTGSKTMTIPRVIAFEKFDEHPLLVISTLRPDVRQKPLTLPVPAAESVLHSTAVVDRRIAGSRWAEKIVEDLASVTIPEARRIEGFLRQLSSHFAEVPVRFGGVHGDFGAWNMARSSTVPMIWDWERYSGDCPGGVDLYHFALHTKLRSKLSAEAAYKLFDSPALRAGILRLQGHSAHHESQLSLLPLMYLITIATRFVADGFHHQVPPTLTLGVRHLELAEALMALTIERLRS